MSETFVSQRQFAGHIGRSHVWVSKLVKAGKLPVNDKGKIPLGAGIKAYNTSQRVGYDANRKNAEKQRAASKKPRGGTKKKPADEKPIDKSEASVDAPATDEGLPPGSVISVDKVNAAFNRARLAEKTFQAKLKELEYKEAQGLLLKIEDVEADAAQTAAALRERLMSLAPRVAPVCEGKSAREIESLIEDGINDVLTAFRKSRFGRDH